jgi:hypothetical protein
MTVGPMTPRPHARPARGVRLGALAVCAALLSACGGDHARSARSTPSAGSTGPSGQTAVGPTAADGSRPLSQDEANRLAVVLFKNYDAGVRQISVRLAEQNSTLTLAGWMDFAGHRGYVRAVGTADASLGLIGWDAHRVATKPTAGTVADHLPPLPPPAAGWTADKLVASSDPLGTVLIVLVNLGRDRPENPQLLVQSDARWLRSDTVDGRRVDVIVGPASSTVAAPTPATSGTAASTAAAAVPSSSTGPAYQTRPRYWIDSTGVLVRFEGYVSRYGPTRIDFAPAPGVAVPAVPESSS